tara:strand:+ start:414 stop:1823 length:1410 start_codon:yes stop_codon:yes gene_type:complete
MNSNQIDEILFSQREYLNEIRQTSHKVRIEKIRNIIDWIYVNRDQIQAALNKDLSKPEVETDITEIWVTIDMAQNIIKNLKSWMSPKRVPSSLPILFSKSSIEYYPKGLCLIIAPWNYPFQLSVATLLYSIAAGNCSIIKPSELTPNTSALTSKMVKELFSPKEVSVIEGDKEVSKLLLEKPFHHIFFTGSQEVGKKVVEASAKYLSSVTLELGGKSPVIIDKGYNLKHVSDRLITTKFINLGQSCIAPDYVLVHKDDYSSLVQLLTDKIKYCYGDTFEKQRASNSLARIINKTQYNRLRELITINSENIIYGGESSDEDNFIAPTIMNMPVSKTEPLQNEIFGPIIPIVKYSDEEEIKNLLSQINNPLAIYIFSSKNSFIKKVKSVTNSGAICINDIAAQFINHNLPFGGVMTSGQGRYHGFSGFKEFSNSRSIIVQSRLNALRFLSPPYTKNIKKLVKATLYLYRKK